MLLFHGNGEIVADYDEIAGAYRELGAALLVVDYRGYGRSGGEPLLSTRHRRRRPGARLRPGRADRPGDSAGGGAGPLARLGSRRSTSRDDAARSQRTDRGERVRPHPAAARAGRRAGRAAGSDRAGRVLERRGDAAGADPDAAAARGRGPHHPARGRGAEPRGLRRPQQAAGDDRGRGPQLDHGLRRADLLGRHRRAGMGRGRDDAPGREREER
ncbi:MAG: hypothetical protein MZV63_06165 [Marinilabiliales bacterium]|nr:hypothetical protein [Marinilabiliales bacterium]